MAAAAALTGAGFKLALKKGAKKKGASVFLNSFKSFKKQGLGKQAVQAIFGKKTAAKPPAGAEEKKPTFADHLKSMQEVFGGVGEQLKSFGTATVGAAADLETDRIGFDFVVSKLKPPGGKGGKGKGPTNAAALQKSFADYWTALRDNAQTTAFSADDVLKGGTQAIKLTKGDTGKAMQLVKLAEDMAGFNPGKTVAEAMEAIEAANGKDYKKLEEFGFEFKKGSWNKFLTDAGKWFDGGSKKLNESANGMWEIVTEGLKGSLQNAGVAALDQVKPIMQKLVTWLTNGGFKKLENIAAKTVDVLVKSFLWLADVLGPVFGWLEKALDWVSANFDSLRPVLNGLIAAFAAFTVISTVASIISGIGVFIGLLSNPIFWVVAAIGLLTAAWTGNWGGIQDKTKAAIAWIVSAFNGFVQSMKQFIADTKQLFQFYALIWNGMVKIVSVAGSFIINTVRSAFQSVSGIITAAFDTIVGIGQAAMDMLRGIFKGVWQGAAGDHQGAVQTIRNAVMGAIGKVGSLLAGFASKSINYAKAFVYGYVSGLGQLYQTVQNAVTPVWQVVTQVWGAISSFVASAMRSLWSVITKTMTAIKTFFIETWDNVSAAVGNAFTTMYSWAANTLNALWGVISPVLTGIGEFTTLMWGIVVGAFAWGVRIVYDLMTGFVQQAMSFGTQFMESLIQGFQSMWGTLVQTVQQIWDSVKSIFGSAAATVNMAVTPINGSHLNGLNRVPFNGYIAQLHQGEMVLTSEQANQYRGGQLSAEQQSSMLQPYSPSGGGPVNNSKSVEIANLVGEIHVHDEADENRFIDKLKRMLEEDLLTEGEGVYAD